MRRRRTSKTNKLHHQSRPIRGGSLFLFFFAGLLPMAKTNNMQSTRPRAEKKRRSEGRTVFRFPPRRRPGAELPVLLADESWAPWGDPMGWKISFGDARGKRRDVTCSTGWKKILRRQPCAEGNKKQEAETKNSSDAPGEGTSACANQPGGISHHRKSLGGWGE